MSAPPLRGVAGVYRHIIDDVVTRVRTDFVQEGVDEAVLDELRELWETKLDESEAIAAPPLVQAPPPGPVPQYYQLAQGAPFSAAPAAAAFDPSKLGKPEQFLQTTGFLPAARPAGHPGAPQQAQLPAAYGAAVPAPSGYAAVPASGGYAAAGPLPVGSIPAVSAAPAGFAIQMPAGRPAAAATPGSDAVPAAAPAAAHVPAAGMLQAQHIPQQQQQYAPQRPQQQQQQYAQQHVGQQAAAQQPVPQQYWPPVPQQQPQQLYAPAVWPAPQLQQAVAQQLQHQQQAVSQPNADTRKRPYKGPDQGGPPKQPYQQPNCAAAAPAAAATIPQRDGNDDDAAGASGGGGGDDAFAGSDEGDDPLAGLSSDDEADGDNIPNVVLAQFEKVARTKTRAGTKWKCQLKNGIMHLNGRDIIFHKCNGEMHF